MPGVEPQARLTDAEFRMFSQLLRRHCALHFGPESRYRVERRLLGRLRELELTSFAAYHYRLRSESPDDGELSLLVEELTTKETFFFRERRQLDALVNEICPEALNRRRAAGGGPVVVWSAGCSSGEEPYSIAMLAREAGLVPGRDLRIYASDLSRRMLTRARRGEYREGSFRETEPELRDRYFTEHGGVWRIAEELKKDVDFIRLNLIDRQRLALLGRVDAVVCRNVIIYFDAESKRRVIQSFYDRLCPGGHLLLGHSESLIQLSTAFELRQLKQELVYQRPTTAADRRGAWLEAAADAVRRETPESES